MTIDKEMSSTAASDASKFMTENQAENSPPSMPTTEPPPQTIDQGDKDQCGNVQNNKKRKVTEASTKINDVSNAEQPANSHKNGTSNLANHLRMQCKKFPKDRDPSQTVLSFQDSKGSGTEVVAVQFDSELCRQALARMLIVDELPFSFVENEGFRYFMSVTQPRFKLPGRMAIARDCLNLYTSEKHKLRNIFTKTNQSVSLTTDTWTSVQNINYMVLTAHFIDENWKMHKRILNFCPITSHRGEVIGKKIEKCLEGWMIDKVFTITVDNASSNDLAISYLKNRMEDWNSHPLKGEYLHVRCCAHILNLVVGDGLKLKDMHTSISKIRSAVRFVRGSASRLDRFKVCVKEARIQDKSTVQYDCATRWNSTYIMLESALKFQKAFKRLSEKCVDYAMLESGVPNNDDWENAKCFVKFLELFFEITKKVSGSTYVTSSTYFTEHCNILEAFNTWMGCHKNDPILAKMATNMISKYSKYWGDVSKMNMLVFIAVIFDPRCKFQFVSWGLNKYYDKEVADSLGCKVKETLTKLFESYSGKGQEESVAQEVEGSESVPRSSAISQFEKEMSQDPNLSGNEVDLYLTEPREMANSDFDILNWWKVNSTKYPTLGLVARDILAMPISTVASESAFSTGVDIEEHLEDLEKLEEELAPIPQLNEGLSDIESD
ncbi:cellulase [Trifolium repens]|nr:cellulase [Trifolium repens]